MSTESIEVSGVIHAAPERIYQAWLNSNEHTAMTGGRATVDPNIGGRFSVWDGYAEGSTIELEPGRRIVQRWRSSEFPLEAADSLLEIRLEPLENGTRVAFLHSEIPEGQATKYEQGWREHYLEPMGRYFSTGSAAAASTAATMGAPPMGEAEAPKPKPKPKPPAKTAAAKPAAKKAAPKKAASARAAKKKSPKKSKKASRRSARKPAKKARKGKSRSSKRSARRGKR